MERKDKIRKTFNYPLLRHCIVSAFEENGALSSSKLTRVVQEKYPDCPTPAIGSVVNNLLFERVLSNCHHPDGPKEGVADKGFFLTSMTSELIEREVLEPNGPIGDLRSLLDEI